MCPVSKQSHPDIWTQFHDLRHPTTFIEPYSGAVLDFWTSFFGEFVGARTVPLVGLDIGTGNLPIPKIMLGMKGLVVEIHAIDTARIRSEQIPEAENLSFHRFSSEETGFPEEMFDLVTSCFALEYSNVERSLAELFRIMKYGARAAFLLHHQDSVSVQSALRDLREDIPHIISSGIFPATRKFVRKPSKTNRKSVQRILEEKLDRPEWRSYWRVDAIVKTVGRHLVHPDPLRYSRWEESFMMDQKRRKALIRASIEDPNELSDQAIKQGFVIQQFEPVVGMAHPSPEDLGRDSQGREIFGWGMLLLKPGEPRND